MAANPPPYPAYQPTPAPPSLPTTHTSNTPYHMPPPPISNTPYHMPPPPIHHPHHASSAFNYLSQHQYNHPPYSHCNPPQSYPSTHSPSAVNATNTDPPSHHLSFNYHHPAQSSNDMPVQPHPTFDKKPSNPHKLIVFRPPDEFGSAPAFDTNLQFDTFDQTRSYVESYAKKMHFKVSVNSSSYNDGIASRGYFYCSPKSCIKECSKPKGKKDCQCIFNLNFNKSAATGKYSFSKPELRHSHPLTPINILIDGKEFVKFESDLTDPEVTCIQNLALCYFSIPMLETNLERIFPGRAFDKTLLSRMRDKALDNELGKDRHNLPSLAKESERIWREGGSFQIIMDDKSTGIKSIHIQKKSWRDNAVQYAADGPKMVDGSHQYSRYKVIAIPWTGIDGLGLSCIMGVTFNLSENSSSILEGAETFFNCKFSSSNPSLDSSVDPCTDDCQVNLVDSTSTSDSSDFDPTDCLQPTAETEATTLDQSFNPSVIPEPLETGQIDSFISPNSAIMSDEGPAFPIVASDLGCKHVWDRKHFSQQIVPSWHEIPDNMRDAYCNIIHDILNSTSEASYQELMQVARTRFNYPKPIAFLDKIHQHRHKVCWAYTCSIFTMGQISDQRAETTNSCVKGKGTLKSYLSKCTLTESVKRIELVSTTWHYKAFNLLITLRQDSRYYGENYKNGLMRSKEDVMQYSYCQRTTSVSSTFIVKTSESDKDSYHVDLNGEMMFRGNKINCMKCSCCFFRSTWIICGHICRAVQEVGPDSFGQPGDPQTVHPYFLVYNHPLWESVCKHLSLSSKYRHMPNYFNDVAPSTPSIYNTSEEDDIISMNTRIFAQIGNSLEGLTQAERCVKFDDLSREVKDAAIKSNRTLKIAITEMTSLYNKLNTLNLGASACVRLNALEKSRKRGRAKKDDLTNKSHLLRGKNVTASDDNVASASADVPIEFTAPLKKNPIKRRTPSCSVCKNAGVPEDQCKTHIASNPHCPSRHKLNSSTMEIV